MSSPHSVELPAPLSALQRPFRERAMLILWPAFVTAGVLEMLVFVVVDPTSLHWFGADAIEWSRSAVYSVTFFLFWGAIATAGAITALLESPGHS
jgi:hypothetical protein